MPKGPTPAQRQAFILDWLVKSPSIEVSDICREFGVSEVTARNDLIALERSGRLKRTHGGASSLSRTMVLAYPEERASRNVTAKDLIGRAAARLVADGDTIIVDIGTTALEFTKQLAGKRGVEMITADVAIATYASFSLPNLGVTLPGGTLMPGHLYLAGPLTLDGMSDLHADIAFVSADAFHVDHGLTVVHDFSSIIKRTYLKNARRRVLLLDSSKFGKTSLYRFADLDGFDVVVTDRDPEGYLARAVAASPRKPRIVIAGDDEPPNRNDGLPERLG